jgi:murein DD-endopeptidase MepM/ murein hydrolase activator NlpD
VVNSEIRKHRTLDGRLGLLLLAIAGLAVALAAGLPLSGVAERTTATAGASVGGGLGVPGKPQIKGFTCLERCVAPLKATPGSRLRITGAYLNRVLKVVFRTEGGTIGTRFVDRDPASVEVDVPDKAVTGKIYAVTGTGTRSNKSSDPLEVLPASQIPREVFPVRGRVSYGSGGARFGAPRGGYSHQGQDLMAPCGTGLVSIRRARVLFNTYHSAAGWYVVLRNLGTNTEFAYMHLIEKSRLKVGQKVGAGSVVGRVGQTGRAYGCHLHFEFWQGRWQMGGRPIDPLPYLRTLKRSR